MGPHAVTRDAQGVTGCPVTPWLRWTYLRQLAEAGYAVAVLQDDGSRSHAGRTRAPSCAR